MTGSNTSVASPGAVRSVPKPLAWWLAGGLGLVGAGALAGALVSGPKTEVAPPVEEAPAKVATVSHAKPAKPAKPVVEHAQQADSTVASAAVCSTCGVVESVRAEKRKGEGTGIGAVAGGVLGGVVGHQIGGGNGKKALTVLGAVGGGFAGHEVEKQARSVTVYQVQLRMDDGSSRTVTQSTAPALGTRVEVEGNKLKALPAKA